MKLHFSLSRLRMRLLAVLIAVATAVAFAGCEKPHDHAEDGAHADEHDDHGDHAHGAGHHEDEVKLSANAIARYGIRTEPLRRHRLIPTVLAPARVAFNAETMAHVGAVLRGRVLELKAKVGDVVKRGDVLLVVESPDIGEAQSEFLQKGSAVTVATPSVQFAKDAYERARSLYEASQGIALTELQKREADYRAAEGALQSAQSAFTAAENRLHLLGMDQAAVAALAQSKHIQPTYSITAPLDGQVIEREVTLGELVSPENDALLILADTSQVWILADVPEARLAEVAVGSSAKITVLASGATPLEGKVTFIGAALNPGTRSASVRIVLDNPKGNIRPGMFAQVELAARDASTAAEVLAVPADAVQTVEGGPVVFIPVAGEENTFMHHPVSVGKAVAGMVPILSGLKEGDSFVSAGSFLLKAEHGKGEAGHQH